jgi:hypothetical protein
MSDIPNNTSPPEEPFPDLSGDLTELGATHTAGDLVPGMLIVDCAYGSLAMVLSVQ